MTTNLDIFNPQISVVPKGLKGKKILIYGDNGTGKTFQATRMPKPYYLGFEEGLDAIAGVPFLTINKWSDFKKINKQLTDPKTLDKAQELYQTLIFDEVYASALMCEKYIVDKYGAEHIGEPTPKGSNRPNLYKAMEKEYWEEFNKLTKAGYTVVFIGHTVTDGETGYIQPKGDKRTMQVVRDNCTVCAYLKNNGFGEDGEPLKSSAYFVATDEFFARSRLTKITPAIKEFTAENLEKAISDAVTAEEASGGKVVDYDEFVENKAEVVLDLATLKGDISNVVKQLIESQGQEFATEALNKLIVEHLGDGASLKEVTEKQVEQLSMILFDLQQL